MVELAKLQDDVPPAPYEQIDKIMRHDLGQSYEKFEHINSDAVSGASLGQVYLAQWMEDRWPQYTTRQYYKKNARRC